jgi:TonB family protein
VVEPNGKVERVRVMRSLDATFGLDDEAIKAAKQWLFKPGMLKDTPVPVVVWIAMEFRLTSRDDPTPIRIEITPQTTTGAPLTTSPTAPVLLESPPPDYTPQARLLAIRGVVQLEAIVLEDGTVATPKVLKSLERGLDDQAIAAVGKWRFRPAMLGERPVAVPVILRVEFRNQPDQ